MKKMKKLFMILTGLITFQSFAATYQPEMIGCEYTEHYGYTSEIINYQIAISVSNIVACKTFVRFMRGTPAEVACNKTLLIVAQAKTAKKNIVIQESDCSISVENDKNTTDLNQQISKLKLQIGILKKSLSNKDEELNLCLSKSSNVNQNKFKALENNANMINDLAGSSVNND